MIPPRYLPALPVLIHVSLLTQLGLSLTVPPVLCLLVCSHLADRYGLGSWVYVPGFILGFGSSYVTAWKLYRAQMKKEKKKEKERDSFNRHI